MNKLLPHCRTSNYPNVLLNNIQNFPHELKLRDEQTDPAAALPSHWESHCDAQTEVERLLLLFCVAFCWKDIRYAAVPTPTALHFA